MIGSARADFRVLIGLVLLGMLVRLLVLATAINNPPADPDNYLPLAESVAKGEGLRFGDRLTAYRPPLYPILLAPGVALVGSREGGNDLFKYWVFGLHLVLGALTILATFLAARRWEFSRWAIYLSTAIVAFDPVLVIQSKAVMTETLAAALVAGTLAVLGPARTFRDLACCGIGLGLCALCRPSLLPVAPLLALALILERSRPKQRLWTRLSRASILLIATITTLFPWALRNTLVFGEPVWTTTHGGYTLALANNPVYYKEVLNGPPGAVWSGPNQRKWFEAMNQAGAGRTEPEADRLFQSLGLRMLQERPEDFLRASIARLGRFWGIAPAAGVYPEAIRWATALWTVPLWGLLGLGLLRRDSWHWPRFSALCFLIGLTVVHSLYWTDMRMRAPLVPAIALIASGGLALIPLVRIRHETGGNS